MSDTQVKSVQTGQALTAVQVKRDFAAQEVLNQNLEGKDLKARLTLSQSVLDLLDRKLTGFSAGPGLVCLA